MRYKLSSLLCLLLIACNQTDGLAEANKSVSELTSLKIFMPEGMQYSQDCNVDGYVRNIGYAECFLYPISEQQRTNGVDQEQKKFGIPIGRSIGDLGYKLGKQEGIHLWFEKPFDENCNMRLVVLFWYDTDTKTAIRAVETNDLSSIENNSVVFVQAKNLACNEQRLVIP